MIFTHKIFHLEDAVEREQYAVNMNNYLSSYSTELDVNAVRISNDEELNKFLKDNPDFKLDPYGYELDNIRGWRYGEIGVWASNFLAWKKFLTSSSDAVILMEDDILFEEDFMELLTKYIKELPEHWDAFFFAVAPGQFNKYGPHADIRTGENICIAYQDHWMLCYVMSKKGVEKALAQVSRGVNLPLDWFFFRQHFLFSSYTLKPTSKSAVSGSPTETTFQRQPRKIMTIDS
jgi:GR25 family glycosyltransferase involved in LPS biosynthesis